MVRYVPKVSTIAKVRSLIDQHGQAYYAVGTTWWTVRTSDVGTKGPGRPNGLPCDPRGSVLMQADALDFLREAEANADHYGSHGLVTFLAAFHGNLVVELLPTSLGSWGLVNEAVERAVHQANDVLVAVGGVDVS